MNCSLKFLLQSQSTAVVEVLRNRDIHCLNVPSRDGTQRMVAEKLSYATDPSKYFVQPRLGYLSYSHVAARLTQKL